MDKSIMKVITFLKSFFSNKYIKKYGLIVIIISIAVLVLVNVTPGKKDSEDKGTENISQSIPEFLVEKSVKQEITKEIHGLGSLALFDKATIVAKLDGYVEKIYVKKGDTVKRGQLLLELSNFQLEVEKAKIEEELISASQEMEQAKLELTEEEKNIKRKMMSFDKMKLQIVKAEEELKFIEDSFDRKAELYKAGGLTEEEYRSLEFSFLQKKRELEILKKEFDLSLFGFRDEDIVSEGFQVPTNPKEKEKLLIQINTKLLRRKITFAEIRLKLARLEQDRVMWLIGKLKIIAPIEGIVTEIAKFIGEKVKTDDELTTILNLSYLYAKVSFSEEDLGKIERGLKVKVYIDSIKKETDGIIYTYDPYIDVSTRTFSVDCKIQNTSNLIPGMFVKVSIPAQKTKEVILISKKCMVQESETEGYVYIVTQENRIFKRTIVFEQYTGENVIVVSGLEENEEIVVKPLMNMQDGLIIKRIMKN